MKKVKTWFWVSVAASLLHFTDNVLRLDSYPDLPITKASSIVTFGIVMFGMGFLGYWIYLNKLHKSGIVFLYTYALMSLIVLGHYLPSRLTKGFWGYGLEIHLFIWLEALTSLVLIYYLSKKNKS